MQTLRLAWRNLWRNGRRTAITVAAVTFGTAVLIVSRALVAGIVSGVVRNATDLAVGEVQVHAPGWLAERSFYDAVRAPDRILAAAAARGLGATARAYGHGLAARDGRSAGAVMWGVDSAREAATFDLARHVAEGRWLAPAPAHEAVLGRRLARALGAGVGDELVVVVQAADGSLGNELYTVTGVLKAVGETLDRTAAILHRDDFAALFVSGGRVHEVAITSSGRLPLAAVKAAAVEAAPTQDVRTWRELLPVLADLLAMTDASMWILGSVFFLAAGLGVLNTMLMAMHERVPELGILKALGTPPWRLARDVAVEALLLALLGTVVGLGVGVAGAALLARHGIDTSALAGETTIAGIAWDPVWRAALAPGDLPGPVLAMWGAAVVAALYPAVLAARLDPVRAIGRV